MQKDVLSVVRISTNIRKGENSNEISDEMTALYQERHPQRDFSWVPSIFKEKFMVSLRTKRKLVREHLLITVSDP